MRDADLEPTGRELKDPAATLVECVDSDNLKHTVIAFDEAYRGHPALTTGVDMIMSFMAYPMVTGLVECNAADTKRARFAYPTGTIWTMKEVLRGFDQVNQAVGARAAVELLYLGGMILHEAGETGPLQGCFSHGNLNPWRIGLKADGQVQIFGYGLAQVEMQHFVHGDGEHVGHDSIRYAPPERLEGQPEQPSSDTYALAVMACEIITGEPLYDHKEPQKLWDSVKLAEGIPKVRAHKKIPKRLRSVLSEALIYDPDKRLSGMALVDAAGGLLDDPKLEGRTLLAVMERMLNTGAKSSRKLVKAATSAFSMEALKAMAKAKATDEPDLDDDDEGGGENRWGSVTREGTTGRGGRGDHRKSTKPPEDAKTTVERPRKRAEAKPAEEGAPRRRRKRRGAEPDDAPVATEAAVEVVPEVTPEPAPAAEDGTPRRRRRKKRTSTDEPAAAATPPVNEASPADEVQPSAAEASEPAAEVPEPAAETPEPAAETPEPAAETSEPAAETSEPAPTADGDEEDAEGSPRRRRRLRSTEEPPPEEVETPRRRRRRPAAKAVEEAPPPAEAPRRRRRRPDAAAPPVSEEPQPEAEEVPSESDTPETPRRRRRRKPKED